MASDVSSVRGANPGISDTAAHLANGSLWRALRGGLPLILVCAVVQMLGPMGMQAYSFGVFVKPLEQAFGWGLTAINIAFSCTLFGQVLGGPLAGVAVDRLGPRAVALGAVPGMAAVVALMATNNGSLTMFYLLFGAAGFLMAFTYVAINKVISLTFDAARGTALGIVAAGVGIGALFGPMVVRPVVDTDGWAWGYLTMAAALAAATPGLFLWFRVRDPAAVARRTVATLTGMTAAQALRSPRYYVFLCAFLLYGMAAGGVVPNLLPFLTELGLSRANAAYYAGLLGFSTMLGRLGSGFLLDRMNGALLLAVLTLVEAIAFMALGHIGLAILLPALVAYGFCHGGEIAALPYLTGRLFGLGRFGLLFGIASAAAFTGFGLGPIMFGALRERGGTYALPFTMAAALAVTAALLFAWLSLSGRSAGGSRDF